MKSILLYLVLAALVFCHYSWVGVIMWGWFIVPLGAPDVSFGHMLGLLLMLGLAQCHRTLPGAVEDSPDDSDVIFRNVLFHGGVPLLLLILGWLIQFQA